MTSLTSRFLTDTSVLPHDILTLQYYQFFHVVKNLVGDTVSELLRIQAIQNVQTFMLVPDITAILKLDSAELENIKRQTCFHLDDGDYVIKVGITGSLKYLRELFAQKLHEHYHANNDDVPVGQKRPASFSSSEQVANKRGKK